MQAGRLGGRQRKAATAAKRQGVWWGSLATESFYKLLSNSHEKRTLGPEEAEKRSPQIDFLCCVAPSSSFPRLRHSN